MLEIGSGLAEARRRAALELGDVESATMIPSRYLDALEHERFEVLPDDPYRRSFLREYALFLGLDGDVYAAEYDFRFNAPELEEPDRPARLGDIVARRLGELSLSRSTVAIVAILAVVALAVWQLGGSGDTRTTTPPRAQNPLVPPTSPKPKLPAHPVVAPKPASRPAPRALVLTAARGDCWLSAHIGSSTGPKVYEHTLQPGQTVRFGLRKPLWIRLGAPWNLDGKIGRSAVKLPARTGDVVVTEDGLRSAA